MQEIISRENPAVKRVIRLQKDGRFRQKEGCFVCEGEKLLREAAESGMEIRRLFLSREREDLWPLERFCADTVAVPEQLMAAMSDVEAPQGVLFLCGRPEKPARLLKEAALILEDVRDPGNLGTALRTAEAFGIPVVLTGSCADLYHPKTIRATMGSIFRVKVSQIAREALWQQAEEQDLPLYAAALTADAEDIRKVDLSAAGVVIGNEAKGVSREMMEHCRKNVIIPISGAESLNAGVASAIVMWEMRRIKQ